MSLKATLALGALVAVACSGGDDARLGQRHQEIFAGTSVPEGYPDIVQVRIRTDVASGIVLAPELVATALHVMMVNWSSESEANFGCGADDPILPVLVEPSAVEVVTAQVTPYSTAPADATFAVKSIFANYELGPCGGDIAILRLERPIPAPTRPIRLDVGARRGEAVQAFGWGARASNGVLPAWLQRSAPMPVAHVGPTQVGERAETAVMAGEFVTVGTLCHGDSGGPALDADGNLLGLFRGLYQPDASLLDDPDGPVKYCNEAYDFFTDVSAHRDLVIAAFEAVGAVPRRAGKPPPAAFASACEEDLDCESGLCLSFDDKKSCSKTCDSDLACGEGYRCTSATGAAVCIEAAPAPDGGGGCSASSSRPSVLTALLIPLAALARGGRRRRVR